MILLNRILAFLESFKKSDNEQVGELKAEIKKEQKNVEESGRP